MLTTYRMVGNVCGVIAESSCGRVGGASDIISPNGWVRFDDAYALELRIAELEQQLKTQDQLRAEFEKECG